MPTKARYSQLRRLLQYKWRAQDKPLYPDPDSIERDLSKYVAEYLINRTDLLSGHYLAHKFWEEFRSRFELSAAEFEPYQLRESFQPPSFLSIGPSLISSVT